MGDPNFGHQSGVPLGFMWSKDRSKKVDGFWVSVDSGVWRFNSRLLLQFFRDLTLLCYFTIFTNAIRNAEMLPEDLEGFRECKLEFFLVYVLQR